MGQLPINAINYYQQILISRILDWGTWKCSKIFGDGKNQDIIILKYFKLVKKK